MEGSVYHGHDTHFRLQVVYLLYCAPEKGVGEGNARIKGNIIIIIIILISPHHHRALTVIGLLWNGLEDSGRSGRVVGLRSRRILTASSMSVRMDRGRVDKQWARTKQIKQKRANVCGRNLSPRPGPGANERQKDATADVPMKIDG